MILECTPTKTLEPPKRCCRCQRAQPISAFNRNRANKDGLSAYCRTCSQVDQRKGRREEQLAAGTLTRPDEYGKYKRAGSVALAADLPDAQIAQFFADTHSREFLIDMCVEWGLVDAAPALLQEAA